MTDAVKEESVDVLVVCMAAALRLLEVGTVS